ncbi:MAG: ferredoxin family protein [Oscillospiraceae bacterium]
MAKFHLEFNRDKCKGCEMCKAFCPKNLISMSGPINSLGYVTAVIENEAECVGCLSCATMCPDGVIAVFKEE